jgi:D-alanine-D-alanine ligase-like ATP-grasp enzyme
LKKKEFHHASNENSSRDKHKYDSQDAAFTATSENHIRENHTMHGFVSGIQLSVFQSPVIYNATTMVCLDKRIKVNRLHEMMGHCGTEKLQKTANILGFKLIGSIKVCQNCAIVKARQKNIDKE